MPAALTAAALVCALSACGSSSKSSTSSAAASPTTTRTSSGGSSGAGTSTASTTPAAAAQAVTVSVKSSKVGKILAAGPKHKTVYLFEGDTASASTCNGGCASVWPPVTGSASAGAGAMSADLGTITRSDGTKQVTYKGHPLYFYSRDGDAGDSYGQAIKSFGAEWYVLAPSGNKVDTS